MQGQKYSKSIMDYVMDCGIKSCYEVIRLTVHKDNTIAISLYKKYGFIRVPDNFYTIVDRVLYCFERELD